MENWVNVSPVSGTGNQTVKITVENNSSGSSRNTVLNISTDTLSRIVSIIQKGLEMDTWVISYKYGLNDSDLTITKNGQEGNYYFSDINASINDSLNSGKELPRIFISYENEDSIRVISEVVRIDADPTGDAEEINLYFHYVNAYQQNMGRFDIDDLYRLEIYYNENNEAYLHSATESWIIKLTNTPSSSVQDLVTIYHNGKETDLQSFMNVTSAMATGYANHTFPIPNIYVVWLSGGMQYKSKITEYFSQDGGSGTYYGTWVCALLRTPYLATFPDNVTNKSLMVMFPTIDQRPSGSNVKKIMYYLI